MCGMPVNLDFFNLILTFLNKKVSYIAEDLSAGNVGGILQTKKLLQPQCRNICKIPACQLIFAGMRDCSFREERECDPTDASVRMADTEQRTG